VPPPPARRRAGRPSRGPVALLAVLLAVLLVAGLLFVPRDADRLREAVDAAGALAPLAFVAGGAGLTLAFFPFPLVAAAGGLLFGIAAGTALSVAAETLGAACAFVLARHGARPWAAELAGPRLAAVLAGIARRGFSAVLLVRVLPGVPRHPANYAFGLTPVALRAFVAATVLGTAPRALGYATLGGTLGDLTSPASLAAVGGLAALGVLGIWLAGRDPELRDALRAIRPSRRLAGSRRSAPAGEQRPGDEPDARHGAGEDQDVGLAPPPDAGGQEPGGADERRRGRDGPAEVRPQGEPEPGAEPGELGRHGGP
jgi:uncharacterized membrane protein YdjX (TVP38/TMEM64 family)